MNDLDSQCFQVGGTYRSGAYLINPIKGEVVCGQGTIKIRPKTFQLLLLMLSTPGEIVSKETFLNVIWDDVCVDEQVLFQSIKELRKVFSGMDAIKTYPRKGYAWIAPVAWVSEHDESENETPDNKAPENKKPESRGFQNKPLKSRTLLISPFNRRLAYGLVSLFFITIVCFFHFSGLFKTAVATVDEGSIIVLPMTPVLQDAEHKWVRYGAMDQIIQTLNSTPTLMVWQVEDVLEMFSRTPVQQENYTADNIQHIFLDSGASLVVESRLAGIPGEYQLLYKLHQPYRVDKGVIFGDKPNEVVHKLASAIAEKTGQSLEEEGIENRSAFSNELLAVAIEALNEGDHLKARNYLQVIVNEEPNNFIARRYLAWSTSNVGEYSQAEQLIQQLIHDLQSLDADSTSAYYQKQLGRARFVRAQNYISQERYDEAMSSLENAFENTSVAFDWLYQGNIKHAMGAIYALSLDYANAEKHYLSAAQYYDALQCPYGSAEMHLSLSEISLRQGKMEQAMSYINDALNIAKDSDLGGVKGRAELLLSQYQKSNQPL